MIRGSVTWALSVAGILGAAATQPASAEVEEGQRLYRIHCQGCHGASARGDGAMRDRLDPPPADLTTIAQRHQGEFPRDKILQIIDGRQEIDSHGSRDMPVWGFSFQSSDPGTAQEEAVGSMISALTLFLQSVQVETLPKAGDDAPQR